jgi:hypothetical protein
LERLTLAFGDAAPHRYAIETSDDGVAWKLLVDRRGIVRTGQEINEALPEGSAGRWMRVLLEPGDVPATLAEVKVLGHPL